MLPMFSTLRRDVCWTFPRQNLECSFIRETIWMAPSRASQGKSIESDSAFVSKRSTFRIRRTSRNSLPPFCSRGSSTNREQFSRLAWTEGPGGSGIQAPIGAVSLGVDFLLFGSRFTSTDLAYRNPTSFPNRAKLACSDERE